MRKLIISTIIALVLVLGTISFVSSGDCNECDEMDKAWERISSLLGITKDNNGNTLSNPVFNPSTGKWESSNIASSLVTSTRSNVKDIFLKEPESYELVEIVPYNTRSKLNNLYETIKENNECKEILDSRQVQNGCLIVALNSTRYLSGQYHQCGYGYFRYSDYPVLLKDETYIKNRIFGMGGLPIALKLFDKTLISTYPDILCYNNKWYPCYESSKKIGNYECRRNEWIVATTSSNTGIGIPGSSRAPKEETGIELPSNAYELIDIYKSAQNESTVYGLYKTRQERSGTCGVYLEKLGSNGKCLALMSIGERYSDSQTVFCSLGYFTNNDFLIKGSRPYPDRFSDISGREAGLFFSMPIKLSRYNGILCHDNYWYTCETENEGQKLGYLKCQKEGWVISP